MFVNVEVAPDKLCHILVFHWSETNECIQYAHPVWSLQFFTQWVFIILTSLTTSFIFTLTLYSELWTGTLCLLVV